MLFVISGLTNASVTASGTIEGVTATQFGYFKAGQVYVNVHTTQVPSGEVRGDVAVGNVGGGQLSARNMVPAGSSAASGTLAVRFMSSGAVWYSLSVAGIDVGSAQLVGPAAATVASTNTLFTISAFTASAATGVFHAEGMWTGLTSQQIQWLAANLVYASVRSVDGSTNIRTQIVGLAACGMMYGYSDLLAQVWPVRVGREGGREGGLGRGRKGGRDGEECGDSGFRFLNFLFLLVCGGLRHCRRELRPGRAGRQDLP